MMRRYLIALSTLLVGVGVAYADFRLTGDLGMGPYKITASGIVDATGAIVTTDSTGDFGCTSPTGFRWQAGPNSTWRNGLQRSRDTKETEWTQSKHCGGAGLFLQDINSPTVIGIKLENSHDGILCNGTTTNVLARRVHIWQAHDDSFQCDNRGNAKKVRVENSFFEEVHTVTSFRRGDSKVGATPPIRLEIVDSVISMGELRNSRQESMYPWNMTKYGHGQLFKTESGTEDTILLRNNVIMERTLPKTGRDVHCVVPSRATIDPASGGNVFVWLGPKTAGENGGIAMVSVDGAMVPESLCLHTPRLRAIFSSVTNDEAVYNSAVTAWRDGNAPSPPPPPPPPPPGPNPVPPPDPAAMAHVDTFTGAALALTSPSYTSETGSGYANVIMPSGSHLLRGGTGLAGPNASINNVKVLVLANAAPTVADYSVSAKIGGMGGTETANRSGIVLGYQNGNGYATLFAPGQLRLYRLDNNVAVELASSGQTVAAGDVIELRRVGTTISLHRNGTQVASATDAKYTHIGKGGLLGGAWVSSTHDWLVGRTYDELRVTGGGTPPPPPPPPPPAPPAAPTGLRSTNVTHDSVALAWNSVTGAHFYSVYRDNAWLANSDVPSILDATVQPSTMYRYHVTAYNEDAELESEASAALEVTTPRPVIPPPPPPTEFRLVAASHNMVELAWGSVEAASSYHLYRDGTVVATTDGLGATDSTVEPSTWYSYHVTAVNDEDGLESEPSAVLQVTTAASPPPPPTPPPAEVSKALTAMDEAVAGLRAGTDVLLEVLPGDIARAARNTGKANADKLVASMDDLNRLFGVRPAFNAMRALGVKMQERVAAVRTALDMSETDTTPGPLANGQAALDAVNPQLTLDIEAAVPAVRAAAGGSEPPPPPPPPPPPDPAPGPQVSSSMVPPGVFNLTSRGDGTGIAVAGASGVIDLATSECFNRPLANLFGYPVGRYKRPFVVRGSIGNTFDLRGARFDANPQRFPILFDDPHNTCVVGPTVVGLQSRNLTWAQMKTESNPYDGEPVAWENSTGRFILEGGWFDNHEDGVGMPFDLVPDRSTTWSIRHSYFGWIRDDAIENDGGLDGDVQDSFFDGLWTFSSSRPSKPARPTLSGSATLTVKNSIIRQTCMPDTRVNSWKTDCPSGQQTGVLFKTGDLKLNVNFENVVILVEAARDRAVVWPSGTYKNVTLIWESKYPVGSVPAGVTVTKSRDKYNQARASWIQRHGCDANAANCSFLRSADTSKTPPVNSKPYVVMSNKPSFIPLGNGGSVQWWTENVSQCTPSGTGLTLSGQAAGQLRMGRNTIPGWVDKEQMLMYGITCKASDGSTIADSDRLIWFDRSRETVKPSVPANVKVIQSAGKATLTWTESTDNFFVASYRIYRNGAWVSNVSGNPIYVEAGLSPGSYLYQVEAFDAFGNLSGRSSAVSAVVP